MPDVSRRFVLVVDDQSVVADTIVLVLKQAHYDAAACYSALEVLSTIHRREPDILLCDVVLGSVSGIDVAVTVSTRYPNCRIILMSGNTATSEMIEQARLSGISFPILAKPIPPRNLLAALAQSLSAEAPAPLEKTGD